ncbi:hypothetical protein Nepgr_014691 [Nepenthes gracilis]|uniref:Uncharacterized protein n=1 Tax=Nepenthes gracilis TaxID=150966 RepID=A0AAD3SLB7_NEPGR|nr:hypothetical protein Nepgr_014691 [Nepenthes gracilis]
MVMLLEFMLRVVLLLVPGRMWLLDAIPVGSDPRLFLFPAVPMLLGSDYAGEYWYLLPSFVYIRAGFILCHAGYRFARLSPSSSCSPWFAGIMEHVVGPMLNCWTFDPGVWSLMMDGTPLWMLIMLIAGMALDWLIDPLGRNPEAGFSFGSDAPVCWVSSTGDGWTTALVFGADDPSGGRS